LNRKIRCPKGVIRPAMDRMRESMFSILGVIEGYAFLDLFSGSGLVGIEAASRGAEPVVLVERDRKKLPVIKENISIVETEIRLLGVSAESYLKSTDPDTFDIVYLDPPFDYANKEKLITLVGESGVLRARGLCLIHYPREDDLPETAGGLEEVDTRTYGRSVLRFYRA
jgi:16S rRNA (guanine966-N2)-methyltransferase